MCPGVGYNRRVLLPIAAFLAVSLAAAQAAAPTAPTGGSWLAREEAQAVARLLEGTREGEQVSGFIARLDADPGDLDAYAGLDRLIAGLSRGGPQGPGWIGGGLFGGGGTAGPGRQGGGPLGGGGRFGSRPDAGAQGPRQAGLEQAYQAFKDRQMSDAIVQNVCQEVKRAFSGGRLLSARERSLSCNLFRGERVTQGSKRPQIMLFNRMILPQALRAQAARLSADGQDAYLKLDEAMVREDWEVAQRQARALVGFLKKQGEGGRERAAEAEEIEARARVRAEVLDGKGGVWDPERLRVLAGQEPARAERELEAWAYAAQRAGDKKRVRDCEELLRGLYERSKTGALLLQAHSPKVAGDSQALGRILVDVLENDPRNEEALALLKQPIPETALRQVRQGDAALRADSVLGQAHYNRGLKAYLQGDAQAALGEWRQALKADPRMDAARKAVAKVQKEQSLTGGGNGP